MHPTASSSSHTTSKPSLIPQKRSLDTTADDGIRCKCGYKHDDGFSIGCDQCANWCHGACFGIYAGVNEPEHWLCWECEKHQPKNKHKRRKSSPLIIVDDQEEEKTYVPISKDVFPQLQTRERLREHASTWRGVTAISPSPTQLRSTPDSHSSILPPAFTLHTATPVPPETYLSPYVSSVTPSSTYLADPLNAYAHLGMPKPFVHLIGPPLDLALDSRISGNKSRWVRSGCRPNAVLRPMLCTPTAEQLSFGLFATRALEKDEEIVLGWEWDDGNVIHHLPALLDCPDVFKATEKEHIRKQMRNVVHALESTFARCACGKTTKGECAIERMKRYVDGDEDKSEADLGPLVGSERGFRTQEKVPWSGGMGGVEMFKAPSPLEDPADIVPPKMRKGSIRMNGQPQSPTSPSGPTTSPTFAFANLTLASPFVHTQPTMRDHQMDVDVDVSSPPSFVYTSGTPTSSPTLATPRTGSRCSADESTLPPMFAHKVRSSPSLPAALSRRSEPLPAIHSDVDMVDIESDSPQPPSIDASPQSSPIGLSTSRSRSVHLHSPPPTNTVADSREEHEMSSPGPVPRLAGDPEALMPVLEPFPPLSTTSQVNPILTLSPSPPPSSKSSSLSSEPLQAESVPEATLFNGKVPSESTIAKTLAKPPTPPPNRPNENSPPLGATKMKLTFRDYARRKKEQRDKEQQKVAGTTVNFHEPTQPPTITSLHPIDGHSTGESSSDKPVGPSQAGPPSLPPSWSGSALTKDPLPPELKMDRPSLPINIHPPSLFAKFDQSYTNGADDTPCATSILLVPQPPKREASLPADSAFMPKAEDLQSLGRELAHQISQDSSPSTSPPVVHHLPPKPALRAISVHRRERSNSPLSPMGDYGNGQGHGLKSGGKAVARPPIVSRMSPPRQPTKFAHEEGEVVQPPRYPRSMTMAGPASSKPIPSGPRAMRGLR